jgi:hypothetical protein
VTLMRPQQTNLSISTFTLVPSNHRRAIVLCASRRPSVYDE